MDPKNVETQKPEPTVPSQENSRISNFSEFTRNESENDNTSGGKLSFISKSNLTKSSFTEDHSVPRKYYQIDDVSAFEKTQDLGSKNMGSYIYNRRTSNNKINCKWKI